MLDNKKRIRLEKEENKLQGGNQRKMIERVVQAGITLILFILIFFMIDYVDNIQGTARVVNYAGLVRGETQRLIKLEITGVESPQIVEELDEYVKGIKDGSKDLSIIKIKDTVYQAKISELCIAWKNLKLEIDQVRKKGYINTNIVEMSEDYFQLSDEAVALAEKYSQMCATNIQNLEIAIILCIIIILIIMLKQSFQAIQVLRMNHELNELVYWDEQTNLPNKNKCAELLEDASLVETPTTLFMFDLNNLKYVNDNMGHEEGDELICNFAGLIRAGVPKPYFVGRYGGDEFIVILSGTDKPSGEAIIQNVADLVEKHNKSGEGNPISYAVGYAGSEEFEACTLRILLAKADKKMYENKRLTKKNAIDLEKQMDYSLMQMIQAMGNAYKDSCFCNAKTGTFRSIHRQAKSDLIKAGELQTTLYNFVHKYVHPEDQESVLKKLELSYIKEHISLEHPKYEMIYRSGNNNYESWWKLTVLFVDADEDGSLFHYLLLFEEVSQEVELEYEAKHDGLTKLWNKMSAFQMIEAIMESEPAQGYVMFVLDVDDFKQVNDTFGHNTGDEVLKKVAEIISSHFRKNDIVARFGGDEFFVFVSGILSDVFPREKAQKLIEDIDRYFYEKYDGIEITVSIGAAQSKGKTDIQKLFHAADEALYHAKKSGKNKYLIQKEVAK